MGIGNGSIEQILKTVNEQSSKNEILHAADQIATYTNRKISSGLIEFSSKAKKVEVNLCLMSLRDLDPDTEKEQLLDDFNEIIERLQDSLEFA